MRISLSKALREITRISDNEEQNIKNYMSAINYISNLYKFQYIANETFSDEDVEFIPTFKDTYLSEELGVATITEENELRLITLKSPYFLVDKNIKRITAKFKNICNKIENLDDTMTFYLK